MPAAIRTVYPETGGNHVLYIETPTAERPADGYVATSNSTHAAYYVSKDDKGWSAQLVESEKTNGRPIASCMYEFSDQPTLQVLCLRLTIHEKRWPSWPNG